MWLIKKNISIVDFSSQVPSAFEHSLSRELRSPAGLQNEQMPGVSRLRGYTGAGEELMRALIDAPSSRFNKNSCRTTLSLVAPQEWVAALACAS